MLPGRCVGSVDASSDVGSQKGTSQDIITITNRHHSHSYLTVLPFYKVVCGVAPHTSCSVMGVPTKVVLANSCVVVSLRLCWVPILARLARAGSGHGSNILDTSTLALSRLNLCILSATLIQKHNWEWEVSFEFFHFWEICTLHLKSGKAPAWPSRWEARTTCCVILVSVHF